MNGLSGTAWPTLNGVGSVPDWSKLLGKMGTVNPADQFKNLADETVRLEPQQLVEIQRDYLQEYGALLQFWMKNSTGQIQMPVDPSSDRRFSAQEWRDHGFFEFNAALYLLNAKTLLRMAEAVEAEPKIKHKIHFAVQQWIDASAPSNYLLTNPEAQKKILDTQGESLQQGIANLLVDLRKGRISQTDESQFEVGRNVATTPGAVVYENALFQLIQYAPTTTEVGSRPLLIVPPCINKYYILDLQPENSLVAYAVAQGHTVFLVSWCNPMQQHAQLGWEDYLEEGVIEAIKTTQAISGQPTINALGFCVGGTLLTMALAVLAARKQHIVESLTLLTTLLDFSDTGPLDVYIDEANVKLREQSVGQGGLVHGRELAAAFSSLRSNDLVWNYVVNNYLKGQRPPVFDLLYWNSDSTNLPGPMFCWYLRNTYLENNLKKPGKLKCCGEFIDLGRVNLPTYILGTREDHIVPWTSAYASATLLNKVGKKTAAPLRFVLAASGHIAGVINPVSKNKRSYWVNERLPALPEAWLESAKEQPGSWWRDWIDWLKPHAGASIKAPSQLGSRGFKPIEAAPGRYVKVRVE